MRKIKQESVLRLYKLISNNDFETIEKYKNSEKFNFNFISSEFEDDNNFEIQDIENVALQMLPFAERNGNSEYQAALIFWNHTKHLTPFQASDIGLWNYLNHFPFYSFLQKRWGGKIDNAIGIKNHFIQKSSTQGELIDHTLSGYWWSFYLSVDKSRTNEFELTEVLYQNSSFRTKNFGRYKIFRHKEAVIGTLEFIIENNLNKSTFEENARAITVFLNLLGGIKPLAYFDKNWFKEKLKTKFEDDLKTHGRLFDRDDKEKFIEKNKSKTEQANEILRYFNLNCSTDYKMEMEKNINYDFSIPINESEKNGFLLQCYNNGRVNKVFVNTLLKRPLNISYLNGKSRFDLKSLQIIKRDELILLITKKNDEIFVKVYKTNWITTHDNLMLMGNEITKDLENLKYIVLPIELENKLNRLSFKSSRSTSINIKNNYYAIEWEILKEYLN